MSLTTTSGKSTGFLSLKNEGAQRFLGWAGLAGIVGVFAYYVLPIVLAMTILIAKIVIIGGFAWLVLMFLLNPRFRWAMGFLVQRTINLLVSGIISQDPIGVMKSYLREVNENLVKLSDRIAEIRGAVTKARRDRENDMAEKQRAEQTLLAYKQRNEEMSPGARTQANIIIRREQSIARMDGEIEQGEKIIDFLGRYHAQAEAYRDDMKDNILMTERERKRVKTSAAAFKAAKSILAGGSVGADMYDEALEFAREDAARMVGEMQQFVSESAGALQSFELQQDGAVMQVLARLEEKGKGSLLLDYQPGQPAPLSSEREERVLAPASVERFLKS